MLHKIDGLTVTYNAEGGNTVVINHGNTTGPSSKVVSFGGTFLSHFYHNAI